MKYYKLFFYMTVYTILSGITAGQEDSCFSVVTVKTDRDSSSIYINEKFVDYGRITLNLPKGLYLIEARESERGWGGSYLRDTIQITECGIRKDITFEFMDKVFLTTSPSDASVFSKDSLIGKTPLFITRDYSYITLQKKEYAEASLDLNKYKPGETIALEYLGREKKISFMKTPAFKYLIAGAAVLGAAAVYFKLEADKNYDKYLESGDKSYLNKTDSYDIISGVSMGALQINLGVMAYLFLTD